MKDDTKVNSIINGIAGTASGAIISTIFHPLNVIQTRFQVTPKSGKSITGYQYTSLRNAIPTIYKTEGIGAFFQGLSPSLLGNATAWGSYFLIYNQAKKQWNKSINGEIEGDNIVQIQNLGIKANLCCAVIAGWTTSIITNPIWVIKTRMQIQIYNSPENYTSIMDAFKTVWKEEGIRGLYRGLIPSFFGVSHGAVQLTVYEELNRFIRYWNKTDHLQFHESIVTGAVSKVCATVTTYPYQVVKARLQMRPIKGKLPPYVGVANTVKKIWSNEGFYGFYRGCFLNLMRVTPSSALIFATYEFLSKYLHKIA